MLGHDDPYVHRHRRLIARSGQFAQSGFHTIAGGQTLANPVRAGWEIKGDSMGFVLWVIALIIAIVGVVQLFQGQILLGLLLIVVACLVGPGGYSVFHRRTA